MSLTGPQVQELHTILYAAYNAASLALMVRIRLEVDLPAVADGSHFSDEVFNLIDRAERTDRTNELIEGALADNPDSEELKSFADRYRQSCDAQSSSTVGVQDQPVASNDCGVADHASQIHTQGGAYIASRLTTAGGDFVGRDKVVRGELTNVSDINNSIAVAVGAGATAAVTVQQIFSESDLRDQNNRRVLREMVKEYWIRGVLENSLEHEAAIRLGMTEKSGMVENRPWRVIPAHDEAERQLPTGTSIADVFDQVNQRMLILGEPGSGKTTMLLELARELIKRSDENPVLPSPVVFNLSSWIQHGAPLAEWLIEELGIRYSIPKAMARAWIEHGKLLLLLDGLDEVKLEFRNNCVEGINRFLQDYLVPLAVCSRVAEYEELRVQLKLRGAVLLEPLTDLQIDDYLNRAGPALSVVRTTLQQDLELGELAKSPLMLSIMVLAYQSGSPAELALTNMTLTRRQHLFDAYIQRMFVRRELEPMCSPKQTIRWLNWLSARLMENGQTIFLIEWLQPGWLQPKGEHAYRQCLMLLAAPIFCLSAGIIYGLFLGLVLGLILTPVSGLERAWLKIWLLMGPFVGLLVGLFVGLYAALLEGVSGNYSKIEPIEEPNPLRNRRKANSKTILFSALGAGLVSGASAWLQGGLDLPVGLNAVLLSALISAAMTGLVLASVFKSDDRNAPSIVIERRVPNQGIRLTARYTICTSIAALLLGVLLAGLIFSLKPVWNSGIINAARIGMIDAIICGSAGGLLGGGHALTKHFLLRLAIGLQGNIPLNYTRFLDYATGIIFLRKVGGGYIFVHRLIMEHFANLTEEDIERIVAPLDRGKSTARGTKRA